MGVLAAFAASCQSVSSEAPQREEKELIQEADGSLDNAVLELYPERLRSRARSFDPTSWKAVTERDETHARFYMLGDLLETHLAIGMSAEDVQVLLGPLRDGATRENGFAYAYWIEPPLYSSTASLWLAFDNEERLVEVRLDRPLRRSWD